MKKIAFPALFLLTWYIAGMYESPALMVLAAAELLLLLLMWFLSGYYAGHLELSAPPDGITVRRGETFSCRIKMVNRGMLPVGRFRLEVERSLEERQERREKLFGSCDRGEHILSFQSTGEHCGILRFRIRRLTVYDDLGLFGRKRKFQAVWTAVILPERCSLRLTASFPGADPLPDAWRIRYPENAGDEVRQIREYREGDPMRHIHWNQTARSGSLWIREYEEERRPPLKLLLETEEPMELSPEERDGFYQTVYAVCGGLLEIAPEVLVFWYDVFRNSYGQMRISESGHRDELLGRLYQITEPEGGILQACQAPSRKDPLFRLTRDLYWYKNETLIWHFSLEHLKEELTEMSFAV